MKDLDKTFLDIDELAKKIEERIKEIEAKEKEMKKAMEYKNEDLSDSMANIDEIIKEIDKRIAEIEEEERIDIQDLTDKVNAKLLGLNDFEDDTDDLEKTRYDLEEISKQINEMIAVLEKKKKDKKRKKAMYCDMARRNGTMNKKKSNKNKVSKE